MGNLSLCGEGLIAVGKFGYLTVFGIGGDPCYVCEAKVPLTVWCSASRADRLFYVTTYLYLS
jgi:hypothetical protein